MSETELPAQYTQRQRYLKEYLKEWRPKNRDRINQVKMTWYYKNHDRELERMTKYRQNNRIRLNMKSKMVRIEARKLLFHHLGNKCVKCGFSDERALQFDHIIPIGRKNRLSTTDFYYRYAKDITLAKTELQILCANCNWIKKVENDEI